MGEVKLHTTFWFENLKKRTCLEEIQVNRKIILQWVMKRGGLTTWTGFNWLRIGISGVDLMNAIMKLRVV
jgi:hypothetical protein